MGIQASGGRGAQRTPGEMPGDQPPRRRSSLAGILGLGWLALTALVASLVTAAAPAPYMVRCLGGWAGSQRGRLLSVVATSLREGEKPQQPGLSAR